MKASSYTESSLLPPIEIDHWAGPLGTAYVQVYDDGSTAPGWGGKTFIDKYRKKAVPAEAIARAVRFAIEQPAGVDVNEIIVRPTPTTV